MRIRHHIRTALERVRAFLGNRDANVAMMFGISLIPMVIAAGAGLDLTRAMIVKSNLSEALDATALAVASPSVADADVQTAAQAYFNANYKLDASYGSLPTVHATRSGQTVNVTASVPMPTTLMNVAGIHSVNVNSSTTVVWGQTKLWVSLVLDNTGSMCQSDTNPGANAPCNPPASGTKIASLQAATHNLLTMLQNASANAGDVKVTIVPFVKDVNVDPANSGATWIDWSSWDAANGTCQISSKHSQSSCTSTNGTWTWTGGSCTIPSKTSQSSCTGNHGTWTSAHCSNSFYTTQTNCQNNHYTWIAAACDISGIGNSSTCTNTWGVWTWTTGNCNISGYNTQSSCQNATAAWTPNSHTTWNGCVTDRGDSSGPNASNYDTMNTAPASSAPSKFLAEQYSPCPEKMMPLGYDWTALSTEVDNMVAGGGTNQPIGLVWGWHALSTGDPLNAGTPPGNTTRYIIILSDGLNTQDRWYGDGVTQATQVDDRMTAVCTNAKNDGIIIYALFVDIGGTQGNSSVLQSCASDSSKYWDLTSASQINAAFTAIGQQITNLRVAQ
jgi:Flp pilus assembly protein TadG